MQHCTSFLMVLRSQHDTDQLALFFPYRNISEMLFNYIVKNKADLFDLRNVRIAHVEGTLLEKAFKVKAFARQQIHALLRSQLILHTPDTAYPFSAHDSDSED